MILWASRDRIQPRKEVTVVPVMMTKSTVTSEGAPLFQSPGWIEPRPRPVVVSALTEGVIDKLFVVEGQNVTQGEGVAQLIDVDAQLALKQAENERDQRRAQLRIAKAELTAARARFETPTHLDALAAEAESLLAKTKTERSKLPSLVESARIRLRFADQDLAGKKGAQDAISERLLQRSQSERDAVATELSELDGRAPFLDREIEALQKRSRALATQREHLVEEKLRVADAESKVELAEGNLTLAELAVQMASVRLERTTVKSPITGRVLQVIARPGSRVMGLTAASAQESSNVVTLYDPAMLQIRADVRLEDVPNVQQGQRVRIETASAKQPMDGEVLLTTSTANIQKNTLEVKVAILNPPSTIRPEMLATVTFLSPKSDEPKGASEMVDRVLVPRSLIQSSDGGSVVWVVDAQGRADRKTVQVGKAGDRGQVEVTSGLQPTDRLISSDVSHLRPGDLVAVTKEDPSLGMDQR
jgi:RND family efflux transporter MFP subunit